MSVEILDSSNVTWLHHHHHHQQQQQQFEIRFRVSVVLTSRMKSNVSRSRQGSTVTIVSRSRLLCEVTKTGDESEID